MPQELAGKTFGRIPPQSNTRELREWWHEILRLNGRYSCYATFLLFSSDIEVTSYLEKNATEIDAISGQSCLIIIISETNFNIEASSSSWKASLDEHINKGQGVKVADIFAVPPSKFPCLLLFRDIRSPDYVEVSLRDQSEKEIIENMRAVFSTIQQATIQQVDPLVAVEKQEKRKTFAAQGKATVSTFGRLAEKTLESAIEAWLKAYFSISGP